MDKITIDTWIECAKQTAKEYFSKKGHICLAHSCAYCKKATYINTHANTIHGGICTKCILMYNDITQCLLHKTYPNPSLNFISHSKKRGYFHLLLAKQLEELKYTDPKYTIAMYVKDLDKMVNKMTIAQLKQELTKQ